MRRRRLLDLFCCGGGAAMGYARAGFEVVGVDYVAQPDYPFQFIKANALTFPLDGFDAVHASPPCQSFSSYRRWTEWKKPGLFERHQDHIAAVRDRLRAWGGLYVIENVPGAPLENPTTYCGSSFGLDVRRHRCFESNVELHAPPCDHEWQTPRFPPAGNRTNLRSTVEVGVRRIPLAVQQKAMGIDWLPLDRLSQAIPPAYTEHIGRQLMQALGQPCDARSSLPDAPAAQRHTAHTLALRCADADVLPRTSRTELNEGVPSPASQESVGGEFGQLQLGAGELLGQLPLVPSLGVGGGSAGGIGAVLELSGVHKTSQPQTQGTVNHKLGGAA